MPRLRNHIVLICVVAGYFITVESRNVVIKDSYKNSPANPNKNLDLQVGTTEWLRRLLLAEKLKLNKAKQNERMAIIAKLLKKLPRKQSLRNGEVHDFLHKLNNFINQNTHNYYVEKRNDCHFGFGNPGVCKRHKFRRNSMSKLKEALRKQKAKHSYNYAQHMLVERARYKSSSSSSESDESSPRQKSRFKIVNNKRKGKFKESVESGSESVEQSAEAYYESDDKPLEKHVSNFDEETGEEKEEPLEKHVSNFDEETEASAEDQPKQSVKSDDDDANSEASEGDPDGKYMYLQGTRLQRPDFRRVLRSGRRHDRLPYFLPKRYKWDDDMIHHLDAYWKDGIHGYDSRYHKKYL